MHHTMALATFVCVAWLMQLFLVWLQTKQHKRLMKSLIQTYRSRPNLYLTSGSYQKFMRPATSVFLIVDRKYQIRDCRLKSGYSVFARYHSEPGYIGRDVREVMASFENEVDKRKAKRLRPIQEAMRQACSGGRDIVRRERQKLRNAREQRITEVTVPTTV